MTTRTIIKVLPAEKRNWLSLDDVLKVFTKTEVLEMVQRYQDTQAHAIKYRHDAQARNKMMKARLAELEARMAGLDRDDQEEDQDQ